MLNFAKKAHLLLVTKEILLFYLCLWLNFKFSFEYRSVIQSPSPFYSAKRVERV